MNYEKIIISDIHLGSDVCQSKKLNEFLTLIENNQIITQEIIINGDLFDSWDFRKLKGSHWKILSKLRSLSKSKHIVWINGNHDGPAEIISHLLGVDFLEEYKFVSGNKKIIVIHGDKFDSFIVKYPILTKVADKLYRIIQKLDKSFYLAKLAKKTSKTFLRATQQVKNKAINYAKKLNCNVIICGHTHLSVYHREKEVEYINSGCWTEQSCCYITIKENDLNINFF
jgi:UDP-2,3-diacylglucosamine pyrophosphatase LpxH